MGQTTKVAEVNAVKNCLFTILARTETNWRGQSHLIKWLFRCLYCQAQGQGQSQSQSQKSKVKTRP